MIGLSSKRSTGSKRKTKKKIMTKTRWNALLTNRMKRKLALLFTMVVLALIAVNIRLAYINKTNGDKYTKKVLAQQDTSSTTVAFRRGDILDRNGTVLATSEKVYHLILDPYVLLQNQDEDPEKDCVEPTIAALVQCFDLEESELRSILSEQAGSSYVILLRQLTKDEIADFEALQESKDTGSRIKGVWFEENYIRRYPYNSLACHVLGYTVTGNQGQTGIEEEYSEVLNGTDGRTYKYLNEDLEQTTESIPATDGNTVVSTIDATLQSIVETKIDDFIAKYTNLYTEGAAAKNIGVILMNPQNGEILAMAGDVDFDLNNPSDLVANGYTTQEAFDAMTDEEKLDARNQMWRNFCISDGYEPGSTVKPLTVAAALEMGVVSDSTTFLCDGGQVVVQGQSRIKCAKRSGHGIITLEGSLMFSCNDALMQIAALMGYDTFLKYQEIYNLGLKTNIDLPGEANCASTVFTSDTLGPTELATSSFGQGYNATMIQVASAFSSVINGGYYYKPHVVKKILDADGGTVETVNATVVRQTISSRTSALIRQYLYHTMYGSADANGNNATGRKARIAGYAMGGKTGTAQKVPRSAGKYLVSFIGFAPVDNPQVVCYVVVDEPNAESSATQASSSYAQELWKNIMTEALPYLNIYATEDIPADMVDEVEAAKKAEEEKTDTAEPQEEGTTATEEGTIIDPNTGEAVKMPTADELKTENGTDMLSGITSGILGGTDEGTTDTPQTGSDYDPYANLEE